MTGTPASIASVARGDLVAERAHGLGLRADEGDAGGGAGFGEFRAFGEQAVAGMDRIGARKLGDADDLVDRQIGDLDGVERRALAQVVGHDPDVEAVLDRRVLADAARHRWRPRRPPFASIRA
jgi:hypothetical protein